MSGRSSKKKKTICISYVMHKVYDHMKPVTIISVVIGIVLLPGMGPETGSHDRVVTSFTLQDLVAGHIDYVQDSHLGMEPEGDLFLFHISDGVNRSPTARFNISIQVGYYPCYCHFQ